MAVLTIRKFPQDQVLKQKASIVSHIDASIQQLIDDMIDTMHQAGGVGLAAPQVGVPLRVIVVQMPGEEVITLINPEIVKSSGEQAVVEACLSVPGYYGRLKRPASVTVKGKDRYGKEIEIEASGFMAQAFAHEIDHLNGTLYIDPAQGLQGLYRVEEDKPEGGPQ